ncbi:MAG: hypothetical protein NT031_18085 [Planctomycetota bacterium]|nr:hypothetical protein [Planctomycetota bacterium]
MRTSTESDARHENSPTSPANLRPPRRRWLKQIGLSAAILLVLVAAAPYVVAPLWGPAIVAAVGDSQIKGALRVDRVSLSWFSPVVLEGVRLTHPDGTRVLEVASVRLDSGLLAAAMHGEKFGRLEIRRPRVRLERGRSGEFTLAEALASARPSQPHEENARDKKPAQPAGRLVIVDGEVDFRPPGAPPVLSTGLNLDCTLATLNSIQASFSGTVGPSASLVGELTVAGLMPGGKLDIDSAVVTATLYTGAPVDLASVFDGAGVTGRVEAKIDAHVEKGRVKTVVDVGLTGLAAAKGSTTGPRPVNLAVRCQASGGPADWTALAQMQGDVGDLKVNLAYRGGDKPVAFRLGDHVEALLQGNALPMPDVSADASGGLDFARLAGAIPALANLRPDATIEQCVLEFQNLHFQGGPKPALKGRILLPTLQAQVAGSPVHWDAAEADLAVWTDPAGRIHVDKAQFQLGGELLQFQVSGDADDLTVKANADVAKLYARLGEVFRMEGFTATGQFDLTARLRRTPVDAQATTGDLHVSLDASASARQIAFRKAGRPVDAFALTGALAWKADLAKASDTFAAQGDFTLADGALTLAGEQVKLDRLAFGHDVSYNTTRRDLTLRKARLASPALNLDATGELRNLGQAPLINVTGQYSADWNVLTPLLHQFDDRTPDSFAALKDTAGKFTFTRAADGVAASFDFAGALGKLDFQFSSPRLNALQSIDAAAFLAAAAAGEPVPALPEAPSSPARWTWPFCSRPRPPAPFRPPTRIRARARWSSATSFARWAKSPPWAGRSP